MQNMHYNPHYFVVYLKGLISVVSSFYQGNYSEDYAPKVVDYLISKRHCSSVEEIGAILGGYNMGMGSFLAVIQNNLVLYHKLTPIGFADIRTIALSSVTGAMTQRVGPITYQLILTVGGASRIPVPVIVMQNEAQDMCNYITSLIAPVPVAAPATTPAPVQTQHNPLDDLDKLFSLKERGVLTEEEFLAKKRQLLNL